MQRCFRPIGSRLRGLITGCSLQGEEVHLHLLGVGTHDRVSDARASGLSVAAPARPHMRKSARPPPLATRALPCLALPCLGAGDAEITRHD